MAPKRQSALAAQERAAKKQRAAIEAQQKASYMEVLEALRKNPAVVEPTRRLLVQMGILSPIAGMQASDMSGDLAVALTSAALATGGFVIPKKEDCDNIETDKAERIPAKFKTLFGKEGLNTTWLCFLAEKMEPIALSKHAVRGLAGDKRSVPLQAMQDVFEFTTDLDPELAMDGDLRVVNVLVQELQRLNSQNGRRMREIGLPPNWEQCGFYMVESKTPTGLVLVDRYLGERVELDHAKLQLPGSKNLEHFDIERNYSRYRAQLSEKGGFQHFNCHTLLERHRTGAVKEEGSASVKVKADRTTSSPIAQLALPNVESEVNSEAPPPGAPAGGEAAMAQPVI